MKQICEFCQHYRRHYVKMGTEYRAIARGHCVFPRIKTRDNAAPACEHFIALPPEPPEDSV